MVFLPIVSDTILVYKQNLHQGVLAAGSGKALVHKRVLRASELHHGVLAVRSARAECANTGAHSNTQHEVSSRRGKYPDGRFKMEQLLERLIQQFTGTLDFLYTLMNFKTTVTGQKSSSSGTTRAVGRSPKYSKVLRRQCVCNVPQVALD